MDDRSDSETRTVEAVHNACDVLEALAELGEAGVTEVADHLGRSKGGVHSHLATLYERGFLAKADGRYRLGLRFVDESEQVKRTQFPAFDTARTELTKFAEDTGEYVQIMVEEEGWGVYLFKIGGENAIGSDYLVGQRQYLHASATGKAILAFLPENHRNEIVEHRGLASVTEHTVTDPSSLVDELSTVRGRGFALSDQETAINIRAVGVPILDQDKEIVGAVGVSGPVSRFGDERFRSELPDRLQEISNIIEISQIYHANGE
jgi:DNA-binding IclR family transcriptional regulator